MKNKTKLMISLGTLAATGVLVTSITLPVTLLNKTNDEVNIKLFNRSFKNREELIKYALENSDTIKTNDGHVYFTINDNGKKVFPTNLALGKYIFKNIERIKARNFITIRDEDTFVDKSLVESKLNEILVSSRSDATRYYRGIHNTIFKDKISAIKSYFQYHEVYYYDNIPFRNVEELKRYLYKNYDKLKAIVINDGKHNIESPTGTRSEFYDFKNREDIKKAKRFVKDTSDSLIGILSNDNHYDYISSKDILNGSLDNKFWEDINIKQINAIHINSNNGNALWITDSKKTDSANFYGNYFTKTNNNEIKNLSNSDKWDKTSHKVSPEDIKKAKNADAIGKFFAILNKLSAYSDLDLKDKKAIKNSQTVKHVFDIPKYKRWVANHPKLKYVFEKLKNTSSIISEGKRYNPIYEVPLLYSQTLSNAENWQINSKQLNDLRGFFKDVMDDYQEILETIFPKTSLVDSDGKPINLTMLFGINDSSYDINSTPESEMYKLSESKKFVGAVKLFETLMTNKIINGGAAEFYSFDNEANNDENEVYLKLWTTFSGRADNGINGHDSIQNALGRKLTTKQSKFILKLMKINDSLEDANIQLFKKDASRIINDLKKNYGIKNGKIDWTKVLVEDVEKNNDIRKAKNFLGILAFKKGIKKDGVKRMKFSDFKKSVLNIKPADSYRSNFIRKINKDKRISDEIKQKIKENIDPKIVNSYKSKIKKYNSVVKGINNAKAVQASIVQIGSLVQSIQAKDAYSAIKSVSSLVGTISVLFSAIPLLEVGLQVVSFALDIVAEIIGKHTQHIFKFKTSEDNSKAFYWDGGKSTERFWGMWSQENVGKKDMKILDPIKILLGSKRERWYYNGKLYSDINTLRKQALFDFAHGDNNAIMFGKNNKFLKRGFTYEKIETNKQLKRGMSVYESKEKLIKSLFDGNTSNPFNLGIGKYLKSSSFEVIGGKILQAKAGIAKNIFEFKKVQINALLNKIKPTIVVQMPKINQYNHIPEEQNTLNLIESYELPGNKYYNNGNILTNTNKNTNKYLMINLNRLIDNTKKSGVEPKYKYSSVKSALDVLKNDFINNIDVQSIYALNSQFLSVNKFTELSTPKEFNLFKAKGFGGEIKYFKTYLEAYSWLISADQFNLTTIIQQGSNKKIMFDNQVFSNNAELIKYIDNLLRKVGK